MKINSTHSYGRRISKLVFPVTMSAGGLLAAVSGCVYHTHSWSLKRAYAFHFGQDELK